MSAGEVGKQLKIFRASDISQHVNGCSGMGGDQRLNDPACPDRCAHNFTVCDSRVAFAIIRCAQFEFNLVRCAKGDSADSDVNNDRCVFGIVDLNDCRCVVCAVNTCRKQCGDYNVFTFVNYDSYLLCRELHEFDGFRVFCEPANSLCRVISDIRFGREWISEHPYTDTITDGISLCEVTKRQ